MLGKKQIVEIASIVIISFLVGTMFNINFIATGGDSSPWNKVWTAISELQSQIQSMNQTIENLKTQTPKKPLVMTVYNSSLRGLPYKQWVDIICVSNVSVWEGANVLAIATVDRYSGWLYIRHRANDTYTESHEFDFGHFVEMHYVWTNLSAGNYTFAIQGWGGSTDLYVRNTRLTLIIT